MHYKYYRMDILRPVAVPLGLKFSSLNPPIHNSNRRPVCISAHWHRWAEEAAGRTVPDWLAQNRLT